MLKAWREWRGRIKLFAPGGSRGYLAHTLCYEHLGDTPLAARPELAPYQGLSGVWDDYARLNAPDYIPYIKALIRNHRLEIQNVLDLACGTGILTKRLKAVSPGVLGLDASEGMLSHARQRCHNRPGVEFVQADFKTFTLGRQFSLVICAGDSLNYVADAAELVTVFRRVQEHLLPDGLFLFDTSTEMSMRGMKGYYFHPEAGERRFAVKYEYEEIQKRATASVILRDGLELHYRIPIDPADVTAAIVGTDFQIVDFFFAPGLFGRQRPGTRCFFVLRRKS
jgi:SAM-dependent methyltransferase